MSADLSCCEKAMIKCYITQGKTDKEAKNLVAKGAGYFLKSSVSASTFATPAQAAKELLQTYFSAQKNYTYDYENTSK